MMRSLAPVLALALGLAGCASAAAPMTEADGQVAARGIADRLVKPLLRDPDSAVFSGLQFHPETPEQAIIVCGRVNSKNGFGGMAGAQRFIAGGTIMLEEASGRGKMDAVWGRFCDAG